MHAIKGVPLHHLHRCNAFELLVILARAGKVPNAPIPAAFAPPALATAQTQVCTGAITEHER